MATTVTIKNTGSVGNTVSLLTTEETITMDLSGAGSRVVEFMADVAWEYASVAAGAHYAVPANTGFRIPLVEGQVFYAAVPA